MDNPVGFFGGSKNWSHLATYSQHPPQVPAQTGAHRVGRSGPPFPARGNQGVSLKHDFIVLLFSSDCLHCSPLPQYRARLWLTFKIIKTHPVRSYASVWLLCSSQGLLTQQTFTGCQPHANTVLDAGNVETKGCPPSKSSQAPFWKGMRGWRGRGLGRGWGWIRPSLYYSVGSDAGVVSAVGAVGTALREAHTLPLFFPPTQRAKSYSVSQGLIHSGPHLSHLYIPQVLINTTHFQSSPGWCHFLYCCGLNYFCFTFRIHWLFFSTGLWDHRGYGLDSWQL